MKRLARFTLAVLITTACMVPSVVYAEAEEGLFAGLDLGAAVPVKSTRNRLDAGGTFSPYIGYMLNDFAGLQGQLQVAGFSNDDRPGIRDRESTWAFGAHAGPRLQLPFTIAELGITPHITYQAGLFTGLRSDTPISRTSWGYSTGAGVDFQLTDEFHLGLFGRYNWLDQRVTAGKSVEFVTTGISLTYRMVEPE